MEAARVLVVDDHTTFAELLRAALDREPDLAGVGHATSVQEAVLRCRELRPDIVLMDVQLGDGDGIVATRTLLAEHPALRVVVLTAHARPGLALEAADAGAQALLPKDGALHTLLETLRAVRTGPSSRPGLRAATGPPGRPDHGIPPPRLPREAGQPRRPPLTERETEVLALLGRGLDVRAISRQLGITPHTGRGYVKSLLRKLDAHTQLEAVVTATRLGLLRLEQDR